MTEQNKVIIFGGDHHNGLGLARIFGMNGVEVHSVIVGNCKKSFISKSKYIKSSIIFDNTKEAFEYIKITYINEDKKAFIIPYSDAAAYELDSHLDEIKDNFYVPSINSQQGAIIKLMDKQAQYEFAKKYGIKMANSVIVDVISNKECFKFIYPVIIKPAISAEGDKRDICVCNNKKELLEKVSSYANKGYSKALIQEYLDIDYELVIVGEIGPSSNEFVVHKVIRRWPIVSGTNSFSKMVTNKITIEKIKKIMKIIQQCGFCGLIDVEAFVVKNELYLNEINWRNSGGCFRAISSDFFYAYWWYKNMLGIECDYKWVPKENKFSMVEYTDIRHTLKTGLSLKQWLMDFNMVNDFALKFKGDMKPLLYKFLYYIIK